MEKVGRYRITGRLGRGGMSTVYKACAPITGRTVAVKILLPREEIFVDLVGAEKLREIFIEEARIMGEITHDHVAKIIDCNESAEAPFIVLEYFAHSLGSLIGESYRVEKPSRVVSVNKTFNYICQSLKGLERLHFAGIIHRDIKPFNLMLTHDDRVKIIDFGLSRVRGEEKMAIPGMQVGSPYYAAPEQEKNPQQVDERADLFSVGVMTYRMLTGVLPQHVSGTDTTASSLNEELNHDWDEFLQKSLAADPRQRFSTAQEMRHALEALHASWSSGSRSRCRFIAHDTHAPILDTYTPRSEPAFIRYKHLQGHFDLDSLMRPRAYPQYRFEYVNDQLLRSNETGLLWQRKGSGFTLSWEKAHAYIAYLNEKKWQGYSTWRLPTVDEVYILMRQPSLLRDFCFESLISEEIHWLWSCDTCTRKKAWIVDMKESFFQAVDKDGSGSVCAVTSFTPEG